VQHELEDRGAVLHEHLLECIDLVVAAFDVFDGGEAAHPGDQHLLVMGAVKYADRASCGAGAVHAPQIIVLPFLLAWLAECSDVDAERSCGVEHVPDCSILAARIHALEDNKQRPASLGKQHVLQSVDLDGQR
jgi:hypothetical protein